MKSKRRPSLLAFLINSDVLFLCDSVADFSFFSSLLGSKERGRAHLPNPELIVVDALKV
jgi:hypothetical protein